MKHINPILLIIYLCISTFNSCNIKSKTDSNIIISKQKILFDTIKVFDELKETIYFTNNKIDTFLVDTIITSCECVYLHKSIKYILPFNTDSLIVIFKSEKTGYISRGLSILVKNEQEPISIILEGEVIE